MTTEETELTFVRCPNCRGLVPAVASRCRMCGHQFEKDGEESADAAQKKSRVRQRTISVSKQEMFGEEPAADEAGAAGAGEEQRSQFGHGFNDAFGFGRSDEELLRESAGDDDTAEAEEETPRKSSSFRAYEKDYDDEPVPFFSQRKEHGLRGSEPEAEEEEEEEERPRFGGGLRFGREEESGVQDELTEDDSPEGDEDDGIDAVDDAAVPRKKRRRRKRRRGGSEVGINAAGLDEAAGRAEPRHEPASRVDFAPRPEPKPEPRGERPNWSNEVRTEARTEAKRGDLMGTQELDEEKPHRGGMQLSAGGKKGPRREEQGTLLGWLVNYSQDSKGVSIELRGGRYFLGRQRLRDDDLVIADSSISTPHCLLFVSRAEGLRVQDLMSEHGTYVKRKGSDNYAQVHDVVDVQHGDSIRFGTYEVVVCLVP